ncbi:MAG: M20 family metallopeptidase [Sphingobacteriales bacterium]|jgi:amidohydrolase|nr:M20 family metallopeptidase [Sphingobacteriales bacterium]
MIRPEHIQELAATIQLDVVAHRRHLHMHPELSFHEHKTAAYVSEFLKKAGISCSGGIAGTGVVGIIEGTNPGKKVVALRADMDALPIHELGSAPYKSQNPGVMHACGHDAHTASLLGAATILNRLRDQFEGTVKLIFQPAEEKLPGGASMMIQEGVLKNPTPDCIFGQHVMPHIPAGKVGFRSGTYMASTDELYLKVIGKGGHGAMPHMNIDPVLISSHLIIALQQVVSRNANPTVPSVLSFGKVIADGATNVIPDYVLIEGTFRTLSESWRSSAHDRMTTLAHQLVESMGGRLEFEIRKGYPVLVNDSELTGKARTRAVEYLGPENVTDLDIWMAAEDFAYYTHETKACFYRLGTRNESKGITSSVHTPTFDIEEDALQIGCGLMAWLTICELTE